MKKTRKIVVVGAGPAGICAALSAAGEGASVDLYDHNEKIGKKLFITGKGRCNLTNARPIEDFFEQIPGNANFLYSALYTFSNDALMALVEQAGCPLKTERGGRVFPKSDKSSDILKAFGRLLKEAGVHIHLHSHVKAPSIQNGVCTGIILKDGTVKPYDAVVMATGGLSYSPTGSDGSGLKAVEAAGQKLVATAPSLTGLKTHEKWPADISGLSLKNVGLTVTNNGKKVYSDLGELLMTHTGISGPLALTASAYLRSPFKDAKAVIDLKPGLSPEKLDERLLKDLTKNANKDFRNSLSELLPSGLIPVIIALSGIDADKKSNIITKEERKQLGSLLKHVTLRIAGPAGIEGAIVTRGGVDVKGIDPGTMESKTIPNLYLAGEMIDVDAVTGGYNIQIACSTGWLAGLSAGGNDENSH